MIMTDCPWELENLGCRTTEIRLNGANVNLDELKQVEQRSNYVVVKVPAAYAREGRVLQENGYFFAETQLKIERDLSSFNCAIPEDLTLDYITSEDGLQEVLESITPQTFVTDRIALDPSFGLDVSLRRYRNWMKTEFACGNPLIRLVWENKGVGFMMVKLVDSNMDVLLHAIFPPFQGRGLGHLLALAPFVLRNKFRQLKSYSTRVSANNPAIIYILTTHGYTITDACSVFVKHLNNTEVQ